MSRSLSLTHLMPVAVLLDFDGMIVGSVLLKAQAFLDVYRQEDAASLARVHEYVARHGGVTRSVKSAPLERHVFGRRGDDASVARLCARYARLVHEAVVACPFVAGAERFLQSAAHKTDLHLVSGTPHDELVDIVARRGLAGCFESVRGAPITKAEAFAAILDGHAYDRHRVVAVGDALTEYEAARALDISFVAVISAGEHNPFPADVPVVATLENLGVVLGLVWRMARA